MRSAKQCNFPYKSKTICYFEVYKNGDVNQIHHKNKSSVKEIYEAYSRAKENKTTLYAVSVLVTGVVTYL